MFSGVLLRLAVISFRHESLGGHLLPLYRILLHLFFLSRPTSWPDVSCCCLAFGVVTGPLVGARAAQWSIAPFFRPPMISRPVKGEKRAREAEGCDRLREVIDALDEENAPILVNETTLMWNDGDAAIDLEGGN
jgi:hypothetical protein